MTAIMITPKNASPLYNRVGEVSIERRAATPSRIFISVEQGRGEGPAQVFGRGIADLSVDEARDIVTALTYYIEGLDKEN